MSELLISTNKVTKGNPFYNTVSAGGYSTCIVGNPKINGANVLCNCVGFANGAFNETYVKNSGVANGQYFALHMNANGFIKAAKNHSTLKHFVLEASQRPPLGGLIVWGGKRYVYKKVDGIWQWVVKNVNHVAFIMEVDGNDRIHIAQAGYNTPGWSVDKGEYIECNETWINRNDGGTNLWWYQSTSPTRCPDGSYPVCLGFIANPAVGMNYDPPGDTPSEETTTPTPSPSEYPPTVDNISQTSPTTVSVTCSMNGVSPVTQSVKCYYKWGEGASNTSYDGTFSGSGTFSTDITKPREATKISILPEQINADSINYFGGVVSSDLTASYPCVKIWDDTTNTYIDYIPYVWTPTDGWKEATPVIRKDKQWWKLYNTDSELV